MECQIVELLKNSDHWAPNEVESNLREEKRINSSLEGPRNQPQLAKICLGQRFVPFLAYLKIVTLD